MVGAEGDIGEFSFPSTICIVFVGDFNCIVFIGDFNCIVFVGDLLLFYFITTTFCWHKLV